MTSGPLFLIFAGLGTSLEIDGFSGIPWGPQAEATYPVEGTNVLVEGPRAGNQEGRLSSQFAGYQTFLVFV